jgi:DDE superfamily endonuclease
MDSKTTQTYFPTMKVTCSTATQTEHQTLNQQSWDLDTEQIEDTADVDNNEDSDSDSELDVGDPDFQLSSNSEDLFSEDSENDIAAVSSKNDYKRMTLEIIRTNCRLYTGLPPYPFSVVDKIAHHSRIDIVKILITLRKFKLNEPNRVLAHMFELSVGQISKIIIDNLPLLTEFFRASIFWPNADAIKLNLPLNFIRRYKNVQSIIDCFEIKIEKPTQALLQSLSYSDYKSANTIKVFISSTPCGYINFISKGYLGRISDKKITEICGYLEVLPEGCDVMADRGFKHIESLLLRKKCKLIKPPSTSGNAKFTKSEARQTKQIASLRTNIERVIARIRHFKILSSFAVDQHYIDVLDAIIVIAAAITNWQKNIG